MDWDKLRIFHAAAEAGSFTHAGEALRMSQSAVSRQVSAPEKDLKVALFHRTARAGATEQGDAVRHRQPEIMTSSRPPRRCSPTPPSRQAISRSRRRSGWGRCGSARLREFFELTPIFVSSC
jgi:hypothetical protein